MISIADIKLFHKKIINYICQEYKIADIKSLDDARGNGLVLPVDFQIQRDNQNNVVAITIGTVEQRFDDYTKTPWNLAKEFCKNLEIEVRKAEQDDQEFLESF